MLASAPSDQQARLDALHAYDVFDTAPDDDIDRLVKLVGRLLDMPVALVSLVDADRQWFKSKLGVEARETPLEQSICAHAILSDDVLVIEDTLEDPRTADNPLCCGPLLSMRFYAGAPLVAPSGHRLGTLCVLDDRPRRLTETEIETLREMAAQVMRLLDLSRAVVIEKSLRDEIDHRVKNSLQSVASFIRIYKNRVATRESRDALDIVSRRVTAVADLHEALYRSENRNTVELDHLFPKMRALLERQAPEGVVIEFDVAKVAVSAEVAQAMMLVVNEFLANSFKHAFPNGGEGTIRVSITQVGEDLVLGCVDSGPSEAAANTDREMSDPEVASGIGMRLMDSAAQQVRGQLEAGPTVGGYRLQMVIPRPAAARDPRGAATSVA